MTREQAEHRHDIERRRLESRVEGMRQLLQEATAALEKHNSIKEDFIWFHKALRE